jgi:L-threonylcarbamoyladenylate synthase
MPRNLLALVLIKLANIPIAAPSANASTKPSPTAAEHVKDDLDGRIDFILDGGPCDVGVESTVVDGLSDPPAILRPGGISIEQLRTCPGWENVVVGYKDASEKDGAPRAPGMKYRHYSPTAKVFLHESGSEMPTALELNHAATGGVIGIIRTRKWPFGASLRIHEQAVLKNGETDFTKAVDDSALESVLLQQENGSITPLVDLKTSTTISSNPVLGTTLPSFIPAARPAPHRIEVRSQDEGHPFVTWDIYLGPRTEDIARDLFWALRDLDRKKCDAIFVEGIGDEEGDVAAAVMNRLRKAAGAEVKM